MFTEHESIKQCSLKLVILPQTILKLTLQHWHWPCHCKKTYYFKCGSLLRDGALFCGVCGTLCRNMTHDATGSLDSLNECYFRKEMTYQTVVHDLDDCHDIQISWKLCSLQNLKILLMKLYAGQSNVNSKGYLQDICITSCYINWRQHVESKWDELQWRKYNEKTLGHFLENLGILNEEFTYAAVQTTLGIEPVMTSSNHMGFLYIVA